MESRQAWRPAAADAQLERRIDRAERAAARSGQVLLTRALEQANTQDRLIALGALQRELARLQEAVREATDAAIVERHSAGAQWADVARELRVSTTRVRQRRARCSAA